MLLNGSGTELDGPANVTNPILVEAKDIEVVREKLATKSVRFLKDPGFCTMLDEASITNTTSTKAGLRQVGAADGS
jgi:hypothetical protein